MWKHFCVWTAALRMSIGVATTSAFTLPRTTIVTRTDNHHHLHELQRLQSRTSFMLHDRRHFRLLSSTMEEDHTNPTEEDHNEEATFYSPNVKLDPSRYRYDDSDYHDDDDQTRRYSNPNDNPNNNNNSGDDVNEYSFFDEALIYVRAGSGGQGASTYKKGVGGQNGIPDGGNGGKGGNVVLVVDESLNTLAGLTHAWRPNSFGGSGASYKIAEQSTTSIRPKSFKADIGANGDRQFKNGKYGQDTIVRVPPGTVVQEEWEEEQEYYLNENDDDADDDTTETTTSKKVIRYIDVGSLSLEEGQRSLVVAYGGEGGEGSGVTGKKGGRGVKRPRMAPEGGERKKLKLTLKIVADVALVGVPNTGKSTFLAAVTRAKPKIANYPFTTVIPNLGVWIPPESTFETNQQKGGDTTTTTRNLHQNRRRTEGAGSSGLVLCDVPGLIAGAAKGVGLGHAFLRHVERCHVILHLVDATSIDPIADFNMVNREIMKYGTGQLAKMPQIVVVNKMDAFENNHDYGEDGGAENSRHTSQEDWEKGLKTRLSREELESKLKETMTHTRLLWMSAKEKDGVDDLMARMAQFTKKVKESKTL